MNKPRILLIDDNEAFLELFLSLLEANSFDIVPLISAKKAIKTLNGEPVDLIISDVQMPDMTGTELFGRIQDKYPDIPVILITAFGFTGGRLGGALGLTVHCSQKVRSWRGWA